MVSELPRKRNGSTLERKCIRNLSRKERQKLNSNFLHATTFGNLNAMKQCVAHGADVESRDMCSWRAIHVASRSGRLDMFRYLVEDCRANTTVETSTGRTALHIAMRNGHFNVARYILHDCHVDEARKCNFVYAELHHAIINDDLSMLRCLVQECQVDPTTTSSDGRMAFHLAHEHGSLDIIRFFIQDCQFFLHFVHDAECLDGRGEVG